MIESMYTKNELLLKAVRWDHVVTAREMINKGATNLFGAYGQSCLHHARRCEELLRDEIIARGKMNVKDNQSARC